MSLLAWFYKNLVVEPLQLLTFNTPRKEFRVKIRDEKNVRTGSQVVRKF